MAVPNGRGAPGRTNGAAVSVDRFFELSLLGLVASGYGAIAASGFPDIVTLALTAAGLVLRGLMVTDVVRLRIPNRAAAALAVAGAGLLPLDYAFLSRDPLAALVHLVFYAAVLRVLTARTGRDHAFVIVIAFLELLAASLLPNSFAFVLFLALFLLCGVATFASAEIRRSIRKDHRVARTSARRLQPRLAALAASVAFAIVILTGGMFFLLPRTARAAFQRFVPDSYRLPGYTNEVRLGDLGEIRQSRVPVMRVRIQTNNPPANLKFRGNTLSQFNGRRWYNPPAQPQYLYPEKGTLALANNYQLWRKGRRISYEVLVTAAATDALFFAGTPEYLQINSPRLERTAGGSLRLASGSSDGMQYGAYSFLDDTAVAGDPYMPGLTDADRLRYLLLPPVDPRVIALARRLTAGLPRPEAQARAIEQHLRTSYGYTTKLLSREVRDPLAYFLFDRKKGHCEYFAAAMTVMLRAVHIPARVATGFQNGVYNPVSGWYVIRASDAHSWVEAWMPGRGWTSFDPTPAAPGSSSHSIFTQLGFYVDAAETFWNEWVVNYDRERQLLLASRVENSGRSLSLRWVDGLRDQLAAAGNGAGAALWRFGLPLAALAVILAARFFFGGRALRWVRTRARVKEAGRGRARAADATILYKRMLDAMKRRGYQKPAWTTPTEFVRHLPESFEAAPLVAEFTTAYHDLRFGGRADAAPKMVGLLARIERPRRHPAV